MSVIEHENGINADDRAAIRTAILSSRETLESEFERQLERFGVYEDKRIPVRELNHLSLQDRETRREVNAALERELEATEDYERAYRNFIREATKEYLNRYVGLKTLEARGLVTETLTNRAEYGNRSYLHYTVDEIAGELTDTPDDGMGDTLDLVFQEIGAEIRVLFEETDYTALKPDFTVRRNVIAELDELEDDVWSADEAIGWVYQYFGENEREEIDDRIDEDNYKVQDRDIATKTQLFTPRYIVEWMVDNSLGRLWLEMHGDETNINDEDNCFYLAPLKDSLIERDVKDVREIKVLDPACGSGHMLFYAFDLLYEMYLEQGDVPEENIPGEILKHNLYGIDIDPGAVQIAALSLYAKAKEREPAVTIDQINVISADAVLVNGEKKQEVFDRVDTEIEMRILEQVWKSFENIREWGSLVRIEERVEEIIDKELERIESTGQAEFTGDGRLAKQTSVVSFEGDVDESWGNLKAALLERIAEFAEEALERNDPIEEMFVGEVEKSVELLDYFVGNYDVVVTNPPYLGSGKMGNELKQFIKENYIGYNDIYAAFIQRCWEFAGENNYATLVTPENYMFLYSYRKLRNYILSELQLIEGMHLSRYGFDQQKDAYTIPFVLRNQDPSDFRLSRFYRMTEEQDKYSTYSDKITGLREVTIANRRRQTHADVYTVDQKSFLEIGKMPYWLGEEILSHYIDSDLLKDHADLKTWLDTQGEDDEVIRKFWELPSDSDNWVPLVTNGDGDDYYESIVDFVLWGDDGHLLKEKLDGSPRNEDWYFKPGINYRNFSKRFCARLLPEDCIFGKHAIGVFPHENADRWLLIAHLNSTPIRYIADAIAPGLAFEKGDGDILPYIEYSEQDHETLDQISRDLVSIRKGLASLDEVSPEFDPSKFSEIYAADPKAILRYTDLSTAVLLDYQGKIDNIVWENITENENIRDVAHQRFGENLNQFVDEVEEPIQILSDIGATTNSLNVEISKNVPELENNLDANLQEMSEDLSLSPYKLSLVRYDHDLYSREEIKQTAGRLLSYYLGCIMGRWDLEGLEPDEDGIIVFDGDFEDDIGSFVRKCIQLTYDADELYDRETELKDMLGKDPVDWLRENFFRYHHCKEYRRRGQRIPIYWQLESEDGAFSCFLYYHAMGSDSLSKLRGQYVDAKIRKLENRLGSLEREFESAGEDRERELRKEIEEVQGELDDVKDFGERLDSLIDEGFEPDFEAGIWENIQKVDEYDLLQTELDKL